MISAVIARAVFSEDRTYRYVLHRRWGRASRIALFVMLNPSTADEDSDDPTIRKCMGFAERWGFEGLTVVNLFAFRTAYPRELRLEHDPIGPDNDKWIQDLASSELATVIVAWGRWGAEYERRVRDVVRLLGRRRPVECIGTVAGGHPRHPLMAPYRSRRMLWSLSELDSLGVTP